MLFDYLLLVAQLIDADEVGLPNKVVQLDISSRSVWTHR